MLYPNKKSETLAFDLFVECTEPPDTVKMSDSCLFKHTQDACPAI